jgi:3-deoxy-7-phosphoheptulonate synthase
MIAILKPGTSDAKKTSLIHWLEDNGLEVHIYSGTDATILGMIGDVSRVDVALLQSMQIVAAVHRVSDPFKQANRKFHPQDTVVEVCGKKIGGGHFVSIAGPCSVESPEQILSVAQAVKAGDADILRGGAFKPRTSPYAFQGLREEGIRLLVEAKKALNIPIITEIMTASALELYEDVDIIQVGARNMQNFDLLTELGKTKKPILLKRGLASTLQELLMSAEYIMREGNENVILCERGIRTFETHTRNTLDLSAVPALKEMTHLPVIVDPSHGTGVARYVPSMAMAAVAGGADGVMVEVHQNPACAMCDGAQALTPDQFADLNKKMKQIRRIVI